MTDYDDIHEPVELDDIGTVRVSDGLGALAIYIKIAENSWRAIYIDPETGDSRLPSWEVSDVIAGFGVIVYAPKSVERHDR